MMYGLIDCNSFYCSCQQAFDPALKDAPVVVLSNNDGCAISRTAPAKQLGVAMGAAWHLVRHDPALRPVRWFSSNYALYADMSRRVFQVLADHVPRVEPYSIDEMFLDLGFFGGDVALHCARLRDAVRQITKIPTCIGWGPTKTIAKLANYIAKDRPELGGLCDLSDGDVRADIYRDLPIGEVWGIGRRLAPRLRAMGICTVAQFVHTPSARIRRVMQITGVRLQAELQGHPCLDMAEITGPRRGLACTRSFGRPITSRADMRQAVAGYVARAAAQLRAEHLKAGHLSVFMHTSRHGDARLRYANHAAICCDPTHHTPTMMALADELVGRIWKDGYHYTKAGVWLNDLSPAQGQGRLFAPDASHQDRVMELMDCINHRFGRGTLGLLGAQAANSPWRPRRGMMSARYTTHLAEMMQAQAF